MPAASTKLFFKFQCDEMLLTAVWGPICFSQAAPASVHPLEERKQTLLTEGDVGLGSMKKNQSKIIPGNCRVAQVGTGVLGQPRQIFPRSIGFRMVLSL